LQEAILEAQKNKVNQLDIIHGKGEGILKNEVIKLLLKYKNIEPVKNKNQGVYSIRFNY
jgi:dsDNA-specific endonuclease/ATPase MutS2